MQQFSSTDAKKIYQKAIVPYQSWLGWTIALAIIDITILNITLPPWIDLLEFLLGLFFSVNICFLGFKIFQSVFDDYILEDVLKDKNTINSELLALSNFLSKAVIVLIIVFFFAQTHQINLIGLIASLGVAGATIALASQKVLEQILWSIVLYLDNPFSVGDYIYLPDRTLGQVEAVGWRSTKIRLSGKNTLVIVPNSNLAQTNIENLTKARRLVLMVYMTFFRTMSDEEKALIRQLIRESTQEIIGIDSQLTQVMFEDLVNSTQQNQVRAQAIFFVLGAEDSSMELRKALLEIARGNIMERLHNYGIDCKFEEKIVDIPQPMKM